MIRQFLLTLLALVLLTGCNTATTGKKFLAVDKPVSDKALLYVFRISSFAGSLYTAKFVLNSDEKLKLSNGAYLKREITPGNHTLKMDKALFELGAEHELTISAQAGRVYYAQYAVNPSDVIYGANLAVGLTSDGLFLVSETEALKALVGLDETK